MLAFQNCGPAMSTADYETQAEQNLVVANALKPKTEWQLESIERQQTKVELPSALHMGLNFTEIPAQSDVMCAGSCAQTYQLKVVSNCLEADGLYAVGFNMNSGKHDHSMSFNINNESANCAHLSWNTWALDIMNSADLEIHTSHDSVKELLVVESRGNKMTFSKLK